MLDGGPYITEMCTNITEIKIAKSNIHTYIIGRYNPSIRIIDLVSHTAYGVCVNFIHNLNKKL